GRPAKHRLVRQRLEPLPLEVLSQSPGRLLKDSAGPGPGAVPPVPPPTGIFAIRYLQAPRSRDKCRPVAREIRKRVACHRFSGGSRTGVARERRAVPRVQHLVPEIPRPAPASRLHRPMNPGRLGRNETPDVLGRSPCPGPTRWTEPPQETWNPLARVGRLASPARVKAVRRSPP